MDSNGHLYFKPNFTEITGKRLELSTLYKDILIVTIKASVLIQPKSIIYIRITIFWL